MECEQLKSGLVVPVKKSEPEPPPRRYGPLEVRDDERRKEVTRAMLDLWDAMNCQQSDCFLSEPTEKEEKERIQARRDLFEYVGKMLLGADCPEGYELT